MNLHTRLLAERPTISKAQSTVASTPEMRPRKANSEVRKQQNRIASRNYREKRKRKLQQLQQLLEDEEPGEQEAHERSISPYDERSCSGSLGYERSIASASPHSAAITGDFSSPRFDQTAIDSQAWAPPVTSSGQSFVYNDPYSSPAQPVTPYDQSGLTTTTCPAWIMSPSNFGVDCPPANPSHNLTYPSHIYPWPSTVLDPFYTHAEHHEQAVANSHVPSWQYHITEEVVPTGVIVDPYGRRNYQYKPQ